MSIRSSEGFSQENSSLRSRHCECERLWPAGNYHALDHPSSPENLRHVKATSCNRQVPHLTWNGLGKLTASCFRSQSCPGLLPLAPPCLTIPPPSSFISCWCCWGRWHRAPMQSSKLRARWARWAHGRGVWWTSRSPRGSSSPTTRTNRSSPCLVARELPPGILSFWRMHWNDDFLF